MQMMKPVVALLLLGLFVTSCAKPAPDAQPWQPQAGQAVKPLKASTKRVVYSQAWAVQTQAAYATATRYVADYANRLPHRDWAVVMDLDQTVLNNIQYQVALDQRGASYAPETWRAWVEARQASLIPGARDFIHYVTTRGGHVVFVSNRRSYEHDATVDNLRDLGIEPHRNYVSMLLREWPDGSDSKESRFAAVPDLLAQHGIADAAVVAYVGDVEGDRPAQNKAAFFCIPQGELYGKNCRKHQINMTQN